MFIRLHANPVEVVLPQNWAQQFVHVRVKRERSNPQTDHVSVKQVHITTLYSDLYSLLITNVFHLVMS